MPEEKVLPKMKPMVLAEHHPAVVAIDPHFFPFNFLPLGSGGNRRRHCNRDTWPPRASALERGAPVLAGTVFSSLDVF
jgi:hypothetical protein